MNRQRTVHVEANVRKQVAKDANKKNSDMAHRQLQEAAAKAEEAATKALQAVTVTQRTYYANTNKLRSVYEVATYGKKAANLAVQAAAAARQAAAAAQRWNHTN